MPANGVVATGTTLGFTSTAGFPIGCNTADIDAEVFRCTPVVAPAVVGQIDHLVFAGCDLAPGTYDIDVTVESRHTPWDIQVVGDPDPKATEVDIVISDVTSQIVRTDAAPHLCDFQAEGYVPAVFKVADQQIVVDTTGTYPLTLTAYDGYGTEPARSAKPVGARSGLAIAPTWSAPSTSLPADWDRSLSDRDCARSRMSIPIRKVLSPDTGD